MRPEDLTVDIRSRTPWEALDLGLALIQKHRRAVYTAWLTAILPVAALTLLLNVLFGRTEEDGGRWWWLLIWWMKPFYDRVQLLVLSRAVFGRTVRWREILRAFPDIFWRSGLLRDLTWRRLHPLRSFHIPVWQLEGLKGKARRRRFQVLGRNASGTALALLFVCSTFESILTIGCLGLVFLLIPPELISSVSDMLTTLFLSEGTFWLALIQGAAYMFAVSVVEPLYAAAGFSLYLNRRAELEGWDIELGFRTLATRLAQEREVQQEKVAA